MITFTTALHETKMPALVDSGATENFISPTLLVNLNITPRKLHSPIDIHTVDGSKHKDGKLEDYVWLKATLHGKSTLLFFLVAAIRGDHVILGYPFLHRFNPHIDWQTPCLLDGKVQLESTQTQISLNQEILQIQQKAKGIYGKLAPGEAIYIQHLHSNQGKLGEIPDEYQ
jgi:hypothetical protein